ncbi:Yip1 family protein [uncultured Methanospirillum sp.]|uniref:Yip1 family protein n=1 Tax=uncultured Methanospirillum sp. TaxID=262503 RepID=UPI003748CABF
MKQEEGVKRSLSLFCIGSPGVVLSYALSTIVFSFMNPRMTPALFMDLFPGYGQTLVIFLLRYIGLILTLIIVTYLGIRLFRLPATIQKITLIWCYAQTPLALCIIGQFVLTIVAGFITRVFVPFFVTLYIIPFFPLIGIIWMTIIAVRGFQIFQIFTNHTQYFGIVTIILILGFGFLFMQGFLSSVGLSPDKLTAETTNMSQSETIFPTPDNSWSQYRNEGMGITFLFPVDWKIKTTRTVKESKESYVITSGNKREENRSSIGEKGTFSQRMSERSHHYMWPIKVTGSQVESRSLEEAVKSDIAQQTLMDYDLLNQSPIRIDNRTGTIVHMQLISEPNNAIYWGSQSLTMKSEPEVFLYEDLVWVDANGIRYSFHMTSYAAGYDQYSQEFSDILDSVRFTEVSHKI